MGNLWKDPTKRAVKKIIPYRTDMSYDFLEEDDVYKRCAHCGKNTQFIWDIQGNVVIHACANDECINNVDNVSKIFRKTSSNVEYLRQLNTMTNSDRLWKWTIPKPII